MKKRTCIIFGAGERGTKYYRKFSRFFEVLAYTDNNPALWGGQRNGVEIVPPAKLPELVRSTDAIIMIANELHYEEIAGQLDSMGLAYYNCENHLCYEKEDGVWYPVSFGRPEAYKKPDKDQFAVLFVQDKPCTRTNKIAEVLKNRGVLTYSAYTASESDAGSRAYIREFPFWDYSELLSFVNESEFDIVHCSNTPDTLVNILLHSNKKVVHDCHDIVTMDGGDVRTSERVLEYMANTQASGVMYTTERMRDILTHKYGTPWDKTLVVGNYPLSSFGRVRRLPKLSAGDGALHCVYEGAVADRAQAKNQPYRFFEPIFVKLAGLGIHVHIYSHCVPEYLEQLDREHETIHYEGNCGGTGLIERMTRYDLGLLLYPKTDDVYLNLASPNKMTEYLAACLPIVTNIGAYGGIAAQKDCGVMVDLEKDDLLPALKACAKIPIAPDFCDTHGLTMDANGGRILEFYKKVVSHG